MTILNIYNSHTRALVAVDVLAAQVLTFDPIEMSKMIPFVHANAVLTGFGNAGLLLHTFQFASVNQGDFDEMADELGEIVPAAYRQYLNAASIHVQAGEIDSPYQAVVFIGWSKRFNRIRAERFVKPPGSSVFAMSAIDAVAVSPDIGEDPTSSLDSIDKMLDYSRLQVTWGKANYQQFPIGGRLVVAEITRDEMRITSHALS